MPRLCERPGCSSPADVAYGFDADLLSVWLDGFDAASDVRGGVLCRRHADAMVVPLGWRLDDRREPVPQLFKAHSTGTRSRAASPRRRSRQRAGDDTVQLRLDAIALDRAADVADAADAADSAEPIVAAEPVVADVGVVATDAADSPAAWVPQFDQTDDLSGLLRTRGRLLSRAFNGTLPDHG
jgi:hypothetical protein